MSASFHHVYAVTGPTGYQTGWHPASWTRYLCANLLNCSQQAAEFNLLAPEFFKLF
jgi:hypothetical protein